ncbi:MAG: hypothetical protein K2K23_01570 [Muribaculaceae bacterium]|nr:hypothetical protein [Muribaculaceae bacterium]
MENKEDRELRIELRSEKVRKLLGEIPPSLVRWGTALIIMILIGLTAAVCLLPYPYSGGESILFHLLRLR